MEVTDKFTHNGICVSGELGGRSAQ